MAVYQDCGFYGGALSAQLPTNFKDISDIVPIPDNQEVF
jgi:hypothetical protein